MKKDITLIDENFFKFIKEDKLNFNKNKISFVNLIENKHVILEKIYNPITLDKSLFEVLKNQPENKASHTCQSRPTTTLSCPPIVPYKILSYS